MFCLGAAAPEARAEPDGRASRTPANPSSAGSKVSAASTVMATVAEAATATPLSRGWRRISSPSMPMTTVVPAVSTDVPAVRIDVTTAAAGSWLARSSARNLVTMNRA